MDLEFAINRDYLARHTLESMLQGKYSSDTFRDDLAAFLSVARGMDEGLLREWQALLPRQQQPAYGEFLLRCDPLLKKLEMTDAFGRLHSQTEQYRAETAARWRADGDRSTADMENITGLDVAGERFTVWITHPSLKNGVYFGNQQIGWGHAEDFPHYTTIYLWHEILHSKLPDEDHAHAVIQLATDDELRVRLNGGSYPPHMGHEEFFPEMDRLLPAWRNYLWAPSRDIRTFEADTRQAPQPLILAAPRRGHGPPGNL
ncbi:MAG: hypothetical protein HY520_00360 [Candidatus Aenigmarchaeota archaeon]|nr:hypothetical protein [Candidatus Aenigmarchaeota archaeon]